MIKEESRKVTVL